AGIVGLAVMCSRILGLLRELIFAALFGAGKSMDAFVVAFRTPNLLRDMFAEGALSTAFVTTFSKKIETEGDASAWKLASKFATLTAVFMSGVALLGVLLAPVLVRIFAPGFFNVPGKAELTIELARIMYPFILLVSLAALAMGMLNSKNRFGVPAMASSFFNIGSILGGVALGWWLDPSFGERALVGLALGTLIGGAMQLAVQLPSLHRIGFRFRPDFAWRDKGVRNILLLMGPAILAASSVQVNVMINTMFASTLEDGAVTWLQFAFRLMQLPLGIFGVAIATVTLPLVARSAAAGNTAEFSAILARGLRLAFLLTIPSTIGLILLAEPIISVIYERGKFTAFETAQTAEALRFYALGLAAYAGTKVLGPAFYAIDRRKTPMVVSFCEIAVNLLLNWLFTFRLGMGHKGLALATGCVALTNFAALYVLMHRQTKRLETRALVTLLARLAVPCALLAGICLAARAWPLAAWATMPFIPKLAWLFGAIAAGVAAFFGSAALFRIEEIDDVLGMVKRKLRR
ncbi:MAG: murein biosynthesis integral membrane protein MurJ, partial [Chthoniobacteraceae bacterium]